METEIFTCKYFKFGRNTTGLSQWHLRNFLACSINRNSPFSYETTEMLQIPHFAAAFINTKFRTLLYANSSRLN